MKASIIVGFIWAGLASASVCKPSTSASSSLSPSSSSSSSSAPSASSDPNIAAADSNIAADPNNRWNVGGNGGSMVATTCVDGDPVGSCLDYTISYAGSSDFLMWITYSPPTLVEGTTYTWSFEMMRDEGNSGSIEFQVLVSYLSVPVNTNIDISSISTTDWTPLSYSFVATAANGIDIEYSMDSSPGAENLKFRNFQLVAA